MKSPNKRILLVTWGTVSVASSRVRAYQFIPFLEHAGWRCKVLPVNPAPFNLIRQSKLRGFEGIPSLFPVLSKCYSAYVHGYRTWQLNSLKRSLDGFDVILVQKVLLDESTRNLIKALRIPVVFEFDDAVYTLEEQRQEFDAMLQLASVVITTNQESARYAQNYCRNVVQIIGPIDTNRYHLKRRESPKANIVIGWMGSPFTTPELLDILDCIVEVAEERSGTIICAVGAGNIPHAECVSAVPWRYDSELNLLTRFDIGIMPLRDTAWNRGKGGYKLLQYMSCGIPAIASPVGINSKLVDHMNTGILADTSHEWKAALVHLIDSPELREGMGRQARKRAIEEFSLESAASRLISVLESLLRW